MKATCDHYQGQCLTYLVCPREELSREIARVTSHDPCIMMGCVHEYGHTGAHEYETANKVVDV